jgi:hypothetical protein
MYIPLIGDNSLRISSRNTSSSFLFSLSLTFSPLFCSKACSIYFVFFSFNWSSYTFLGDTSASVYVFSSFSSEYLFLKPSFLAFLSNYQVFSNNRCPTYVEISYKTSSLYLPTKKEIKTYLITLTSPHSLSH